DRCQQTDYRNDDHDFHQRETRFAGCFCFHTVFTFAYRGVNAATGGLLLLQMFTYCRLQTARVSSVARHFPAIPSITENFPGLTPMSSVRFLKPRKLLRESAGGRECLGLTGLPSAPVSLPTVLGHPARPREGSAKKTDHYCRNKKAWEPVPRPL